MPILSSWCSDVITYVSWLKKTYGVCMSAGPTNNTVTLYQQTSYDYQMTIKTRADQGDVPFEGQLYATLTGWYGSSDEMLLIDTDKAGPVAGGATQVCTVKMSDIGSITAVQLRAVGPWVANQASICHHPLSV